MRDRPRRPGNRVPTEDALARLYDADLDVADPGDVDLYLGLARRTGGPVLELAAGTGRVAVPLAAAGHEVTAVDWDSAALRRAADRARAHGEVAAERLRLVACDLLDLRLAEAGTFRLGIVALNSLLLLADRAAQRACLEVLADHLAPGGLAVIDVWLPDADDLVRYDGRLGLEYAREDPSTGAWLTKSASASHDAATGTIELTAIYEEGRPGEPAARFVRRDRLRLVGADELVGLAEAAGLAVERMAGSYDMEPFAAGAERVILVALRAGGRGPNAARRDRLV